jgi:putative two-component system response regulator
MIRPREPGADAPLILVVDDLPDNLHVLGELLSPLYRVRIANAGRRALELAADTPRPDLILLDVMMPDMDGYSVLRQLKADPALRDVPVIFLSAMDATEDEERGLEFGAVDYITKPIRPPIVLARIRTHIELKRMRDWLKDQNLLLEAEVARRMADNETIQDVSILALAHLAETRDNDTGNHLRRTQEYIEILARHLQGRPHLAAELDERTLGQIVKSAVLHDIGKVGIPDHILLKPGMLTDAEWAIMKSHARLGAEAIERAERDADRPVVFLALAKQIALRHHERWDGSGYPDGLRGKDIPLAARLMALADVFDALISRRVYKAPIEPEKVRGMILAESGRHFDPEVVEAFDVNFDQFLEVARRYPDDDSSEC